MLPVTDTSPAPESINKELLSSVCPSMFPVKVMSPPADELPTLEMLTSVA